MELLIATILAKAADLFIEAFAGSITEDLYEKLKGDPAKTAYKHALGKAIKRYSTGERLALAKALSGSRSILNDKDVAQEFTHIIRFEREPNTELIGKRWKNAIDSDLANRDFSAESRLLLQYFEHELKESEVFRPIFNSKSLTAIAYNASVSKHSLENIESQLDELIKLTNDCFGDLIATFAKATLSVRDQIRDFTRLIDEKTSDFTGRQFVFDAINQFLNEKPRGYFILRGDPGIGKSSISAQLVKKEGYLHHFNIRAEGINKSSDFLRNICAQLIAAYDLKHTVLPPEAIQDAGFLNKLLDEVSAKLAGNKKCIVLVDGLDEVDNVSVLAGSNTLYLPLTLPKGVYFIATTRKVPLTLRFECDYTTLDIEQNDAGNIADIREFIIARLQRPGVQSYISTQPINEKQFVDYMEQKSEGNFMYLRYVFPEIEGGAYKDLDMDALPIGLKNYYEDHWRRIRGQDENAWFTYKLPVLVALTVVKEPVSIEQIRDFSGIHDRSRIRAVINEWSQFLDDENVEFNSGIQVRYRLYHASFFDFIADKQDIKEERVDLIAAHKQIADTLWNNLFAKQND